MMKSPWNYLARVVLRRESQVSREASGEKNAQEMTPEFQETSTPGSSEMVHEPSSLHSVSQDGDIVVNAAVDDEQIVQETQPVHVMQDSNPVASPIEPLRRKQTTKPSIDVRQRKTKTSRRRVVLTAGRWPSAELPQEPKRLTQEEIFLNELVELDDDIKQLRLALAQKLESQNQQLKRMLSRFHVQ